MNARQEYSKYFLDIYGQVDFIPIKGKGSRLYNEAGEEVIDFAAGIAVNALGHAHPKLFDALHKQAAKLWHTSNIMVNQPELELAEQLVAASIFDKVFLCNSGTEAVEAGIKLARRYALKAYSAKKHKIVAFKNSFHGRTLLAVSVGGQSKYSQDFAPLPGGIIHGEFNNLSSAENLIDEDTAVVIVEPVQAEGGVFPATAEFLTKLRELCNKHNALLMFDEVQTGIGRTGKLFAYQHYNVEPDLISLAKALGGGFPIGAILVKDKFSCGLELGLHGSTFGGNPLACAIATEVLKIVNTQEVLQGVITRAKLFKEELLAINQDLGVYSSIRGLGLLIGAELSPQYTDRAREIMLLAYKNGLASLIASANVTRFTPALNIPEDDIQLGFKYFKQTLERFIN